MCGLLMGDHLNPMSTASVVVRPGDGLVGVIGERASRVVDAHDRRRRGQLAFVEVVAPEGEDWISLLVAEPYSTILRSTGEVSHLFEFAGTPNGIRPVLRRERRRPGTLTMGA